MLGAFSTCVRQPDKHAMTNFTAASGNTLGLAIMGDNRIGMYNINKFDG